MKKTFMVFLFTVLSFLALAFVSAEVITDDLHLNIQTTNSTGGIVTGTFEFVFNISNSSDCAAGNVIYSNSTNLTTDSRGIISYYLPNVSLDYDAQYYLCYYRDGELKDSSNIARVPYAFRARNVSVGGIDVDQNFDLGAFNITTTGTGFFGFLGDLANRITELFVIDLNISQNLEVGGNITFSGNITSGELSGAGAILNEQTSSSNPTIIPSRSNLGYGLGYGSQSIHLIANDVSIIDIFTDRVNITKNATFGGNATFEGAILAGSLSGAGAVLNEQTSSSNPTIIPSRSNLGYGIGYGSQTLHLITNDVNALGIDADQNITIDTNTLFVDALNNRVGIGTTSPDQLLHIKTTTGDNRLKIENTNSAGFAGIDLLDDGGGLTQLFHAGSTFNNGIFTANSASLANSDGGGLNLVAYNANGVIRFATGGFATTDERMRIDQNGNVGINTTSPQRILHVKGDILSNATINATIDVCIEGGNCLSDALGGLGNVSGTGAANRAAFWTGASTLSFDGNFTWDNSVPNKAVLGPNFNFIDDKTKCKKIFLQLPYIILM